MPGAFPQSTSSHDSRGASISLADEVGHAVMQDQMNPCTTEHEKRCLRLKPRSSLGKLQNTASREGGLRCIRIHGQFLQILQFLQESSRYVSDRRASTAAMASPRCKLWGGFSNGPQSKDLRELHFVRSGLQMNEKPLQIH